MNLLNITAIINMDLNREEIDKFLVEYANKYHTESFIKDDPVQFPHRYTKKQDIEISGFITAFLSFGARPQILKAADRVDVIMNHSPHEYVCGESWKVDFVGTDSFYRTVPKDKMREIFSWLNDIYSRYESMEDALKEQKGNPMERLCTLWGVTTKSPQKKVNMFLRWMIRRDSPVDFGIWHSFSPKELIIPLDTHVSDMSFRLGLTKSKSYTLNNAKKITVELGRLFPEDPCLGDFALFGFGVNE